MKQFDNQYEKIMNEFAPLQALRRGAAKAVGAVGKVLSAPKKLDQALTSVAQGYTGEIERKIGGGSYYKTVGDLKSNQYAAYSDDEREYLDILKKLKLSPNNTILLRKAEELKKKILQQK